jgi:hypothetical protein
VIDQPLVSDDGGAPLVDAPFRLDEAGVVFCGAHPCACSNGIDDDGDSLIDGFDPECTGPFDDDEATFGTGIPGDNRDPFCQDCFFDGNSGGGDDGCRHPTSCLVDGTASGAVGLCTSCEATTRCIDGCRPITPNGCDCYGCCEVHLPSGTTANILLGPACSFLDIDDEDACPRCVQSTSCVNECGRCELCPGRTLGDLPADCGAVYTCEDGEDICSETTPCVAGYACQLGCCLPILF